MALIHEALENMQRQAEADQQAQEEARLAEERLRVAKMNKQELIRNGEELRLEAVGLLEQHGRRVRTTAFGTSFKVDRAYQVMGSVIATPEARALGMSPVEYIDRVVLETPINIGEDNPPVNVTLECDTAIPSKSPRLGIHVDGLHESFSLSPNLSPQLRPYARGEMPRSATMEDIAKYKELVGIVKTIHTPTPQPPTR